ncbi:MAG TPA: TetR/AcrR family transcriptional regulator [Microcella sp.]|nr:TetR/AcrR family transcriptional regulator [Microcella sp.]
MSIVVSREQAKAERRSALLAAAAQLFAERGFERVSLDDLGAAVGVSGPAVYRHFAGKQAVLAALLVDASAGLLDGARAVLAGRDAGADGEIPRDGEASIRDARASLRALVAFHVAFAVENPDVIRVQSADLESLADADRRTVRGLQRQYVELWVDVLEALHPNDARPLLRTRAHAAFGLMNSTPHSARGAARDTRAVLAAMAEAALSPTAG